MTYQRSPARTRHRFIRNRITLPSLPRSVTQPKILTAWRDGHAVVLNNQVYFVTEGADPTMVNLRHP